MKNRKKLNHYSVHRINETHIPTKGNGIAREGNAVTVYRGKGYNRQNVGFWNLDNMVGIREVEEGKRKKKGKSKKKR